MTLGKVQQEVFDELQNSASRLSVIALQMVHLHKAIMAVGMFSMFGAILQDELRCVDGFRSAEELLERKGELALKEQFSDLQLAINVLKHGRGRSYDTLVQKTSALPFKVKLSSEAFFDEGDVGEVDTLVEVDDSFVMLCAKVIHEVSLVVHAAASGLA